MSCYKHIADDALNAMVQHFFCLTLFFLSFKYQCLRDCRVLPFLHVLLHALTCHCTSLLSPGTCVSPLALKVKLEVTGSRWNTRSLITSSGAGQSRHTQYAVCTADIVRPLQRIIRLQSYAVPAPHM
jgi:hypothetical protein